MVQLVFVHGVATRDTPEYKNLVKTREMLFRELLFPNKTVTFHSPMWGHFVPEVPSEVFKTNVKKTGTFSLNIEALPSMGGGLIGSGKGGGNVDISVGAIGKQDPIAALDAICSQIADQAAAQNRALKPDEIQVFRVAAELITSNKASVLFDGNATPQSITAQFNANAPKSLGIGSFIGDAVTAVTDRVRNAASTLGFNAVRGNLTPAIGLFISDVFVYLKDGYARKNIQKIVAESLIKAHQQAKENNGPLVVVGHSMGGVILVDMLNDPAAVGLPDDLSVDALLTVGSQPGFFAALDLIAQNLPTQLARQRADCVRQWMNVFDPIDPLAFRSDMIFKDVIDLEFNSVAGISEAHSKYFQRPQFYARARKRLQELNVL
ncbi:hypothetical protein GKKCFE_11485 [Pseudomonas sp. E141]|uniref:hypothetical protein n=1 Tax=Pseudomonas sp. E141 TaxID=2875961 RepID=UPI004046784B